jgi:hypothetical protein
MGKANLRIDWATHEAAKYACVNWHYSGCLPAGKLVKVGAWESGKFIGVVLFSRGSTGNIGSPYGLAQDKICELTRIALTSHKVPVSRIMAFALRRLANSNNGVRLVISYADPMQGHHGGIYQAGNWIYTGSTKPDTFIEIHGNIFHRRSVYAKYGTQSVPWLKKNVDPNARHVPDDGKHKYLMPLDADMRARIMPLAKPYPKRAKQAMTDVQSEQRQGGTDPHAPITQEADNG